MIRLIIYAIIIYFGYRVYKTWGKSLFKSDDQELTGGGLSKETELIQDPQCGTFFLRKSGVTARIEDKTVFFCSESCRDAYLKDRQPN